MKQDRVIPLLSWALALSLCLLGACKERTKKVPLSQAYTDGFQVIVLCDHNEVSCVSLSAAEELIRTEPLATYLIWDRSVGSVEEGLKKEYTRKSGSPEVIISIASHEGHKQVVNLAFHYRKSSYHYCYEATNDTLLPLWSRYKGLIKKRRTVYRK